MRSLLIGLAALAGLVFLAPAAAADSTIPGLAVTLSPAQGPPGTSITVKGSGYNACPDYGDRTVHLSWDGWGNQATVPIRSDGTFSGVVKVPADAAQGSGHLVYGQCVDGGDWARTGFTVTPAPGPVTRKQSLPGPTTTPATPTSVAAPPPGPPTAVAPPPGTTPGGVPVPPGTGTPSPAPPASGQGQPVVPAPVGTTGNTGPGNTSPPGGAKSGFPKIGFEKSLPSYREISYSPAEIAILLGAVALTWFFLGWPAELANETYKRNEATIHGWLGITAIRKRFRRPNRPDRPKRPTAWPVVVLFSAVAASLTAFGQEEPFSPEFWLQAGCFLIAVPLVVLAYEFAIESYHRRGDAERLRVVGSALVLAAGCAAVSHWLHFEPGYVYGLILGYTAMSGRRPSKKQEAVGVLRGAVVLLVLSLAAWTLWQFGTHPVSDDDSPLALRLLDLLLAQITVVGMETLVIGLLPLRFLHGHALWEWRRPVWYATYAVVAGVFLFGILGPRLFEKQPADVVKSVWLFLGFCLGSFAFWAFFAWRDRHRRPAASQPEKESEVV